MNVKKVSFMEKEREEILREFSKSHPNHVYKRLLALKIEPYNLLLFGEEVAPLPGKVSRHAITLSPSNRSTRTKGTPAASAASSSSSEQP